MERGDELESLGWSGLQKQGGYWSSGTGNGSGGEARVWEDDKPSSGHADWEVGMRQRNAVWEVS